MGNNESMIYESIKNESECKKCKIKLTYAGRTYAYLFTDFEYFSCRYNDNRIPLLCSGNFEQESDGEYRCIKNIITVRSNASKCIKSLIRHDGVLYAGADHNSICDRMVNMHYNDVPHPVRVVRQHIGYLFSFMSITSLLTTFLMKIQKGKQNIFLKNIQKKPLGLVINCE